MAHRFAVLPMMAVLITLACRPLSCQEIRDLRAGDRVLVDFHVGDRQPFEGQFIQGGGRDTLVVLSSDGDRVMRFPWGQVRELQVHRGTGNHRWTGLGIGIGAGVVIGYLIGGSMPGDHSSQCGGFLREDPTFCLSSEDKAAIGAVLGGLIGGGVGRMIGVRKRRDRWESVSFPEVRPSIQVAPSGRVRVGFAIPLGR